jgi:hypothetical protein
MKKLFFISLALMVVCGIVAQEEKPCADADKGPAEIVLEASNGNVNFGHLKHVDEYGVACTVCHHTVQEGETPKSCAAEGCHTKTSEINTRNAYHQLCYKGCHKEKNQNEGKAAPTKCSACHIKDK